MITTSKSNKMRRIFENLFQHKSWKVTQYEQNLHQLHCAISLQNILKVQLLSMSNNDLFKLKNYCLNLRQLTTNFQQITNSQKDQLIYCLRKMDFLETLNIKQYISIEFIFKLIKNTNNLKTFSIEQQINKNILMEQKLIEFVQISKHLEKISIWFRISSQNVEKQIKDMNILSTMKNLYSLTLQITKGTISKKIKNCLLNFHYNLKELCLMHFWYRIQFEDPEQLIAILNQMQNLEKLTINYANIDGQTLKFLKTPIKKIDLQSLILDVRSLSQFCTSNKDIEEIVLSNCSIGNQQIKGLEKLKLKTFKLFSDLTLIGIKNLVDSQPQLLSLSLSNCKGIKNQSIILISERLKLLEKLSIYDCQITSLGLIGLRRLRNLKKVQLCRNLFNSEVFTKLIVSLKYLLYYHTRNQKHYLIQDQENKKKTVENINQGTQVWLKFDP